MSEPFVVTISIMLAPDSKNGSTFSLYEVYRGDEADCLRIFNIMKASPTAYVEGRKVIEADPGMGSVKCWQEFLAGVEYEHEYEPIS
jgi:hypothetical protein